MPKRNVKKQRREDRTGINTHYNYDKMTAMFSACIYTCRCTLKSIVQAFIQKKIDRGEKINISEKWEARRLSVSWGICEIVLFRDCRASHLN